MSTDSPEEIPCLSCSHLVYEVSVTGPPPQEEVGGITMYIRKIPRCSLELPFCPAGQVCKGWERRVGGERYG